MPTTAQKALCAGLSSSIQRAYNYRICVNGEIHLNGNLRVSRSDWTLAGQTAPGDGISIVGDKVNLGGSQNFIIRNIRFRSGDGKQDQACGQKLLYYIFDHCAFGWSVEECMNTADSHFLTVQYSIVHEGLYQAGHDKGNRGYGAQWGGSPVTYHHNLLAGNNSRSPRINGARGEDYVVFMEYVNNVNFNWGSAKLAMAERTQPKSLLTTARTLFTSATS